MLGRGLLERSLVLALALAVLSPALGSQPAGADSDAAQLAQTRKELGAIQKKLTKSKGEAAAITGQVKALDKQIDALNKQMGLDTRAIHDLESSIRTHDARIAQLAALYQGAHAAADSRARAIYMGGPATSLSSLLSASSMGDFMRKTAVWQVAAQLDAKVIIQSARLRDALTVEKEDLARSQAALTTKKGALDSRGELLNNALDQRMAALGAVQAQIKAEEAEIEQLTKESEDLTRKLQTDPAISHGNESVSASGLVFPVRGSILSGYGPRGPRLPLWRRHLGRNGDAHPRSQGWDSCRSVLRLRLRDLLDHRPRQRSEHSVRPHEPPSRLRRPRQAGSGHRVRRLHRLIQPYSGHAKRQSLEVYSRLAIGDAQRQYDQVIGKFPV